MLTRIFSALAICVLPFLAHHGHAATFDAAADFDAGANPSGPWSYGTYTLLDEPSTFTTMASQSSLFGLSGFDGYSSGGSHIIAKNTNAFAISPGTPTYSAGSLILHPSSTGDQAVVRWTAATSGTYDVDGGFFWTDLVGLGTTTDGSIYLNETLQFSGDVNGLANQNAEFDLTLTVNSGDTLDFVVGWGLDRNFFFDSTELQATIVDVSAPAIPLPAGLPLLLCGFGVLAMVRKRA